MAGAGIGMAIGPVMGGFLRDYTHNYDASLWLAFALSLVGVIGILVLPSTRRLQLPNWEDALPPEGRGAVAAPEPAAAAGSAGGGGNGS